MRLDAAQLTCKDKEHGETPRKRGAKRSCPPALLLPRQLSQSTMLRRALSSCAVVGLSPLTSVIPASAALLAQQKDLLLALGAHADEERGGGGGSGGGGGGGCDAFFISAAGAHGGGATIGQHLRHSTDHFVRCLDGAAAAGGEGGGGGGGGGGEGGSGGGGGGSGGSDASPPLVRYDLRERGSAAVLRRETDPARAIVLLDELAARVRGLRDADLRRPLAVSFVLGRGEGTETAFASTLGRELAFCAHHAVHHNASMRQIAEALGLAVPPEFGFAPSTPLVVAAGAEAEAAGAEAAAGARRRADPEQ